MTLITSDFSSTLYHLVDSDSDTDSYFVDSDDYESDDAHASSSDSDNDEIDWKKQKLNDVALEFDAVAVVPTEPFLQTDGPLQFFCRFFHNDLFQLLVKQTNLYAAQRHLHHWKDITESELKAFIGILIAMGLHGVPSVDMVWSSDPLFCVQPIASVMTVKRLKKYCKGFMSINVKT